MPIKRARRILSRPQQEVAAVERIERTAAARVIRARIIAALEHRRATATREQLNAAHVKRALEQSSRAIMGFGLGAADAARSLQAMTRHWSAHARDGDIVFLDYESSGPSIDFANVEQRTLANMVRGRALSLDEFGRLYYNTPEPTPCEHQWQLHQPHALHGRNRHRGPPQRRCRRCGEIRNH